MHFEKWKGRFSFGVLPSMTPAVDGAKCGDKFFLFALSKPKIPCFESSGQYMTGNRRL